LALDPESFEDALVAGAEFALPKKPSFWKPAEQILTAEQLAERFRLPQSRIEEATRQGRLPFHEFGRYRRYSLPTVIEADTQERRHGRDLSRDQWVDLHRGCTHSSPERETRSLPAKSQSR
jgi:excisionase family DNA binding protein